MYKRRETQSVPSYPNPKDWHFSSLENNDAEGNETES